MLCCFAIIKDYEKERLIKLGYSDKEINILKDNVSSSQLKKLDDYPYLSFIVNLFDCTGYKKDNLFLYIDYIENLDVEYDLESIAYLVNNNITYSYSKKIVDIINNDYFILNRLERYMNYDSNNINEIITNVNSNIDMPFYSNVKKSDISKDILLIANKYYQLDADYYYGKLVTIDKAYDNKSESMLSEVAYEAFKRLVDDAEKDGYHIRNNSAYRSYETQSGLYNNYKSSNGLTWADKWSARPGHSEHQTGLGLDVGVKNQYSLGSFEFSKEFAWMKDKAHLYGFILRYPKGKEYITGYGYEPWHYRYVGIEAATYIYEHDITFEEYYAYFVEKS